MKHRVEIYNTFGFNREILLDVPCELWIDIIPTTQKTKNRVLLVLEPNSILGMENKIINHNSEDFDLILSHNPKILEKCKNSRMFEFGTCWIKDFDFKEKEFLVTSIVGGKLMTSNHLIRQNLLSLLKNKYDIGLLIYNSINFPAQTNIPLPKIKSTNTKNELFNGQFHIAIENETVDNWFTEKLIDCFQTKTIPIYLGCPNIGDWFDTNGMIIVKTINDIHNALEQINTKTYESKLNSIEFNYKKSFDYVDFGVRVENKIKEFFVK